MRPITQDDLRQFCGSEECYRHWLGELIYTEGVHFLAEHGYHWLLDAIASYQHILRQHDDHRLHDTQFWKLEVHDNGSATLTCIADTGVEPAVVQEYDRVMTDLREVDLWVEGNTILLPSEH